MKILDTWDVSGLGGDLGSHDVMIEDAFVLTRSSGSSFPMLPEDCDRCSYLIASPLPASLVGRWRLWLSELRRRRLTRSPRRPAARRHGCRPGRSETSRYFRHSWQKPSRWCAASQILAPRGRGDDLAENRAGNPRVIRRAGRVQSRGGQCNTQRGGRCRARLHRRRRQRQLPAESSAATSARYPWRDTTHRHRALVSSRRAGACFGLAA